MEDFYNYDMLMDDEMLRIVQEYLPAILTEFWSFHWWRWR